MNADQINDLVKQEVAKAFQKQDAEKQASDDHQKRVDQMRQHGLSDGLARFAAGIQMPGASR